VPQAVSGRGPDDLSTTLERLEPEFRALLTRFRIPAQEAEDILQDTILALLTHRASVTFPRTWLIATFRNRCLLYWRNRRREMLRLFDAGLLEEMSECVAPEQDGADLRRDLNCALDRLPRRCRRLLGLRYGLDCRAPEVAARLGYKADTVRQATLRCLSALTRIFLGSQNVQEVTR